MIENFSVVSVRCSPVWSSESDMGYIFRLNLVVQHCDAIFNLVYEKNTDVLSSCPLGQWSTRYFSGDDRSILVKSIAPYGPLDWGRDYDEIVVMIDEMTLEARSPLQHDIERLFGVN